MKSIIKTVVKAAAGLAALKIVCDTVENLVIGTEDCDKCFASALGKDFLTEKEFPKCKCFGKGAKDKHCNCKEAEEDTEIDYDKLFETHTKPDLDGSRPHADSYGM